MSALRLSSLALCVAAVLLADLASDLPAALTCSPADTDHADGSHCGDPGSDDGPCSDSCPCACCPGHRSPEASASCDPPAGVLLPCGTEAQSPDGLHPEDIPPRIFRPPIHLLAST
jgi:hypothetical protein